MAKDKAGVPETESELIEGEYIPAALDEHDQRTEIWGVLGLHWDFHGSGRRVVNKVPDQVIKIIDQPDNSKGKK